MMARKEYRIFNGKKYFLIGNLYDTKVEANEVARRNRNFKQLARVVKDKYGYRVYRRRK
jgi:hypothetical protein